jgi:hypothetical protein
VLAELSITRIYRQILLPLSRLRQRDTIKDGIGVGVPVLKDKGMIHEGSLFQKALKTTCVLQFRIE